MQRTIAASFKIDHGCFIFRLLIELLETLNDHLSCFPIDEGSKIREDLLDFTTKFMTGAGSPKIQSQARTVMVSLFASKNDFFDWKVKSLHFSFAFTFHLVTLSLWLFHSSLQDFSNFLLRKGSSQSIMNIFQFKTHLTYLACIRIGVVLIFAQF